MAFTFTLSDANKKTLTTAGKYLTDNIEIGLASSLAGKIVSGTSILGVTGTATALDAGAITTTISTKTGTIKPDSSHNAISSVNYTVQAGSCTVAGGTLSGGADVTPSISLSLGTDDLTTSGNEATNIVGSTSKDTLYDSEAAVKTAGYNYFLELNGTSAATSSTVSRAAVTDTHTAGWIDTKATTNVIASASKTVNIKAGSKKKFVGIKAGSCAVAGGAATVTAGTATVTAGTASTTFASNIAIDSSATLYSVTAKATGGNASATGGSVKVTAVTKTQTAGYIKDQSATTAIAAIDKAGASDSKTGASSTVTKYIKVGKLNNAPTSGVTYNEITASTATAANNVADTASSNVLSKSKFVSGAGSVVIPAEGALYLNAGYYENLKINLGTLIPDDADYSNAGASHILKGYEAYTPDGKKLIGTMTNGISHSHGGGTLTSTATVTCSISKAPSVSTSVSGSALKDLSSTVKTNSFGITPTAPTSGTDGTNYITFTPSGTGTAGTASASATSKADITAVTCTDTAGYTAGGTHTCKAADSKTSSDSKTATITPTVSNGSSYYMPVVGVSFSAGSISGSTSVSGSSATLGDSNSSGVSVSSAGTASASAGTYTNSAGAILAHSGASASGTAIGSKALTGQTKYITAVSIASGKTFSVTNEGTITITNTGTLNINGGGSKDKGVSVVGKTTTVDGGTAVTDSNGDLIVGSVSLSNATISQGTTTAAISAGTGTNEISSSASVSTSAPTDGYYVKLALSSPKVTGSVSGTTKAGWISANPSSATVTVNAGSGTSYIKLPASSVSSDSLSISTAPKVAITSTVTGMVTSSSTTSYSIKITGTGTNGTASHTRSESAGWTTAKTDNHTAAITPTITGSGAVVNIQAAADTLYASTSTSTAGFKSTKTYLNTEGYIKTGAKTSYTQTIDTVSGTGTITAIPSSATVNITSNAGTTKIAANTGTVDFIGWKLCNNTSDDCLDIYFE